MIKRDFHVHTTFCDGRSTAEEMVLAAIRRGMDMIGFSGHAYTSRDVSWCMTLENTEKYIAEIRRLQNKYAGQIRILLGTEADYFSDGPLEGYDYKIGSVHYVEIGGKLHEIDDSADDHYRIAKEYCGGDLMALAELYYAQEANVLLRTGADVIGHFNLIEKFNEDDCMYDTSSERYRRAWQSAADVLLTYRKPFEINTGAISRGYRTEPYPSPEMIEYIADRGGSFILSSDSHSTETLLYGFEEWETYADRHGMKIMDSPLSRI